MGEFIDNFDPRGKEFHFNFTTDTCSEIRTGVCELQDFDPDGQSRDTKKLSVCQNILLGLMDGTINSAKMLPYIHKCTCGHWVCTDGQHRICVAQKVGLTLKVEREDCSEECFDCRSEESSAVIHTIIVNKWLP